MYRWFSALLVTLGLAFGALAQEPEFIPSKDYMVVNVDAQPGFEEGASVVEFFSYGCPACYHIEPMLQDWLDDNSSAVNFSRVPVIFNATWQYYAEAYYVAAALDMDVELDSTLFSKAQSNSADLTSKEGLMNFFAAQGVDRQLVENAFNSTTLNAQLAEGRRLRQQAQVRSVPSFVIGGKYQVGLAMADNDPQRLFEIMDYLLEKVREGG